ncbi:MAG: hypothetical protein C4576_10260 [Desulfobacteraceae bacterium]|nr:MAG: hypothetical protein C4576_10260 [Desulfobacteraceae bacterium]
MELDAGASKPCVPTLERGNDIENLPPQAAISPSGSRIKDFRDDARIKDFRDDGKVIPAISGLNTAGKKHRMESRPFRMRPLVSYSVNLAAS